MNEQRTRDIIQEELLKNANSGTPIIPRHQHDGNDTLRVPERFLIRNTKISTTTLSFSDGGDTFILNTLSNPTSISFYGISNNALSKATINGIAQLGISYKVTNLVGPENNTAVLTKSTDNVVYSSNSFLATAAGAFSVGSDPNSFATTNSFGTIVTSATIQSWTEKQIVIKVVCATGWTLQGTFIII